MSPRGVTHAAFVSRVRQPNFGTIRGLKRKGLGRGGARWRGRGAGDERSTRVGRATSPLPAQARGCCARHVPPRTNAHALGRTMCG